MSRVQASGHEEGRAYLALNGYRWDDFTPYLYRSDDYGASWTRFGEGLPLEPVNVVLESPANPDLLYVGTDGGLYVSLDRGETFMTMQGGGLAEADTTGERPGVLPNVPVHDLKVQARERDLVVGTHGRSLYLADVRHVQQLTPDLLASDLHLFGLDSVAYDADWGEAAASWRAPEEPEVAVPFFSRTSGPATLRVFAEDSTLLYETDVQADRGLNYAPYRLVADSVRAARYVAQRQEGEVAEEGAEDDAPQMEPAEDGAVYLVPGTYAVEVALGGATARGQLVVTEPPEPSPEGEEEESD